MKKLIIITIATIFSFASVSTFAQDKIPAAAKESLQYSFENVTNASWSKVSDLYKADFYFNSQIISAFYNEDGDLLATGRNIEVAQMPVALQVELKNAYKDYSIGKAVEVSMNDEVNYYIYVESATRLLQLKSTSYGKWEVYQKTNVKVI